MHNSISACIPTYNDKLTNLLRVTESILNQTVPFKRITIIDDGSRNDLSLLKRSPNICLHKNPENKGRGFIRNQAIKNADTDYVLFCDSTNLLPKRFTEIAIHAFNDPKVAAVSGKISNSETLDSFVTNWRARHLFKQGFNFGNTAQERNLSHYIWNNHETVGCIRCWQLQSTFKTLRRQGIRTTPNPFRFQDYRRSKSRRLFHKGRFYIFGS